MANDKINFSRSALINLPNAPAGKRAYYGDAKEPGLVLCVTGTGTKSFQVYMKIDGRPERVTLGRFTPSLADSVELPRDCKHNDFIANLPELNVRMARSLAALVKFDLKAGVKAADIKREKRSELTLGELFEKYVSDWLIPKGKKRIKDIREDYERYLGELPKIERKKHGAERKKVAGSVNWHHRRISSITKRDVQALMTDLARETSIYAANHALAIVRSMFNRAIDDWSIFTGHNPASGVRKYGTVKRRRFLQADELPRFFESVAQEMNKDVRDYVLLSLLTGARRTNVLSMRWRHVNLDRGEWSIPSSETKNSEPLVIPLMPEAVDILQHRKPTEPTEYVFPGRGKSGHMEDAKAGWTRIIDRDEITQLADRIREAGGQFEWPLLVEKGPNDKRRNYESLKKTLERARIMAAAMNIDTIGARLDDLRKHDMRRTVGSWQAAAGASLVTIGQSLGHKDIASTLIYTHLNIDPVRDSMQNATRSMLAAGGLLPTAEIVSIDQAKRKTTKRKTA